MPTFCYQSGFEHIVPDSYSYSDGCNSHDFKIIKSQYSYTTIHEGQTERFCDRIPNNNPKLCLENWMLSNSLWYDAYPNSINFCINGYRNITYIKKIQKKIDKNFSAEQAKTLEHTRIALDEGICFCNSLFKSLRKEGEFNEKILVSLGAYIGKYFSPDRQSVNDLEKVFNYISAHPKLIDSIVTTEMIEDFHQSYQEYIN